jgi:hypothetical protein
MYATLLLPQAKQLSNLEKIYVHNGGVHDGATLIASTDNFLAHRTLKLKIIITRI